MKVALFSDLHGNLTGTRAVLEAIDRLGGADRLYAAGDIRLGGPGADDLLDTLVGRGVRMLRGNAEESVLDIERTNPLVTPRMRDYNRRVTAWLRERLTQSYVDLVAALPLRETVEVAPGERLFICHAAPDDPWARVCSPHAPAADLERAYGGVEAAVIAYGHWHGPHVLRFGAKLLVNVSSVGFRSDGNSAFTMLEWTDGRWIVQQHVIPYDVAAEERLMEERGVPLP